MKYFVKILYFIAMWLFFMEQCVVYSKKIFSISIIIYVVNGICYVCSRDETDKKNLFPISMALFDINLWWEIINIRFLEYHIRNNKWREGTKQNVVGKANSRELVEIPQFWVRKYVTTLVIQQRIHLKALSNKNHANHTFCPLVSPSYIGWEDCF